MSDGVPRRARSRRRCGSTVGALSLCGRLYSLPIWILYCYYFLCCCSWTGVVKGTTTTTGTVSPTIVPHLDDDLGSTTSSSSQGTDEISTGEDKLVLYPIVRRATDLLLSNYRPELEATIPSPHIDAHQESTTSIMVAQAWAHIDDQRARAEFLSIFRGQWANGLVPTVRYTEGFDSDFLAGSIIPGPRGWGNASCQSSDGANTSALAALPLHAEAALRIFDMSSRDTEAKLWLQTLFPPLFRYHDYLHSERGDPETGLVYVYHPWETELAPDSPAWTALLKDTRDRMANESSWSPPPIPEAVRSAPGFPGEEAYDAAMFLADCAAWVGRVDSDVRRQCPFLLQDIQFNAALLRSDKALLELAEILEATRSRWQSQVYTKEEYERLTGWVTRAESGSSMGHLWSAEDGNFLSRYIPAQTSEASLARPATSAGFSALLAPGMPFYRANSIIDVLLSPGDLSFRCGNYPMPEVECGRNYSEWPSAHDGTVERKRGVPREFETANGASPEAREGGEGDLGVDGVMNSNVSSSSSRNKHESEAELATAATNGTLESEKTLSYEREGEAAARDRRDDHAGGVQGGGRYGGVEEGGQGEDRWRRVWVFHNYLAERGLKKQSMIGLSIWVANETLSLLDPSGGVEGGARIERDTERVFRGGDGDGVGGATFLFYRAFDGETGLPVAHAEGNSSSLSAATSVLLLLGDGPDATNNFPPIAHATLFVLVAIELVFSFAMGVSCLVFSLNLVRKLKEEVDSTARSSHRDRLRRRETRAGGDIDSSDGSDSGGGRRSLGGAFGPWRPGGRYRPRRSANAAEERGIGSLLGRNASSRAELYRNIDYDSGNDVSDNSEYLETVDMTPVAGPVPASTAEAPPTKITGDGRKALLRGGNQDDGVPYDGGLGGGATAGRQRRSKRDPHPYLPISPTSPTADHVWGVVEMDAQDPGAAADERGFQSDGGGKMGGGADSVVDGDTVGEVGNGSDSVGDSGGDSSDGVGLYDMLRPFYASLKFW